MTRRWVLDFERPDDWISANARDHWASKAKKTAAWRSAAATHARAMGIPQLDKVAFIAEPRWTNRRHRDALNVADTFKACVDGLTDAGVLVTDCDCHVLSTTFRNGPPTKGIARLRITIREVPA